MAIEADYYFAAGDLANFGRGLDAMGPIMQKHAERMYVIPGNHESEADIARFCREFGFHDFHGRTMEIAGYNVAGLGYSNPTPFDTPGEYSEQELRERLQAILRTRSAGLDLPHATQEHGARSRGRRETFRKRRDPRIYRTRAAAGISFAGTSMRPPGNMYRWAAPRAGTSESAASC